MPEDETENEKVQLALTELGATGLRHYRGVLDEEWNPELRGSRGYQIYREMVETDPVVGAVIFAIEQVMRSVEWLVEPQEGEDAEFVRGCFEDMSLTLNDWYSQCLSMIPYGFSAFETVFKRRQGPKADPPSRFDDGKLGWRKFAFRSQDTLIDHWDFDATGGVQGVEQRAEDLASRYIPVQKLLLFRTKNIKGSPQGESVLKRSYWPWYMKRRIETVEAIGIERDLAGYPVVYVPKGVIGNPTQEANYRNLVERIRVDEYMGAVLPGPKATGVDAWREGGALLELISSGGGKQVDASGTIERYARDICLTVLAQWVLLGTQQVGSYALGRTHQDLFLTATEGWLSAIAQVLNRFAIPRLMELNGKEGPDFPVMKPTLPRRYDLQELSQLLGTMFSVGFDISDLESRVRNIAGFPAKEEAVKQEITEEEPKTYPWGNRIPSSEVLEGSEVDEEDIAEAEREMAQILEAMKK